jgi:lantibiotic biosynthesis protein
MEEERTGFDFFEQLMLRLPLYAEADYTQQDMAAVLSDPLFRQALWLASPAFYNELEKLGFCFERLDARKKFSLCKYYNRCCFRPTPFGAFSSFSLLSWGSATEVRLVGEPLLHLLPAQEWLQAQQTGALTEGTWLQRNPLLYRLGPEYRYVFSETGESGRGRFLLNSLSAASLHRALFARLRGYTLDTATVRAFLAARSGCTLPEAADYLDFLVREQVLLTPAAAELVDHGLAGREDESHGQGYWQRFRQVSWNDRLSLPGIAAGLPGLPVAGSDLSPFYSALEKPLPGGQEDASGQAKLRKAYDLLQRLAEPVLIRPLQDFMKAFKARFDREKVPLLLALDPDQGITYGDWLQDTAVSPMLEGVAFPGPAPERIPQHWTPVHQLFFNAWQGNDRRHPYDPLVLEDSDLEGLPQPDRAQLMPPSQAMIYRKTAGKLWIESVTGVSATALLGRFSLFGDGVWRACRRIAASEQAANPEVVFAEISQLSEIHADNVSRRRPVYDAVIPLNVFASGEPAGRIMPDELLLSVYGEELILESARLRRRVIPRLPTAYNYSRNQLAVFRLLCDLQHQGLRSELAPDLERLFPDQHFYPRVEYEGVILCPAKWKFKRADYAALLETPVSIGRLHLFRQRFGIPQQVCIGGSDQQLVFDLGNDWEALFFLECLKSEDKLRILEHLPADGSVRDQQRAYTAQFVTALVKTGNTYRGLPAQPALKPAKRNFLPGSDWLYLKLYCMPHAADRLLLELLKPLIRRYRQSLRSWFFIRYADTAYHIRLRLEGEPKQLAIILTELAKALNKSAVRPLLRDLQSDVYRRELERYGLAQIDLVEACFCAGSDWVVARLKAKAPPGRGIDMEACALVWLTVDRFLDGAGAAARFYQRMSESFALRHATDKAHRVSQDKKYRLLGRGLADCLAAPALKELAASACTESWLVSVDRLAAATSRLGETDRMNLLADLVHMQVNRIFCSNQLRYEAMIYHFLAKYRLGLEKQTQA